MALVSAVSGQAVGRYKVDIDNLDHLRCWELDCWTAHIFTSNVNVLTDTESATIILYLPSGVKNGEV